MAKVARTKKVKDAVGGWELNFVQASTPKQGTPNCVLGLRVIYAFGFGSGTGNFVQITQKRFQFISSNN